MEAMGKFGVIFLCILLISVAIAAENNVSYVYITSLYTEECNFIC